ncbi:MAG: hypothetical protein ACEQSQ_06175 [Candidatus Paceibacteria bacterium]
MELELFIERLAGTYFWCYLSVIILSFLHIIFETEQYKLHKKSEFVRAEKGKFKMIGVTSFIFLVIWILSMYYK